MAKRKKRRSGLLEKFSNVSIISLLFNPATMMVLVSVAAMILWNQFHDKMPLSSNRKLDNSLITTNQPPLWIKTDIASLAIKESRLNEIILSQPDAIERVVSSFAVQPWVKQVKNAAKTVSGIQLELEYRVPRAIVEVGTDQLIPIDDEAVVLDSRDFKSVSLTDYWRVNMPRPITSGIATGRKWEDIRIADCVEIANVWAGTGQAIDLFRIVNRSNPTRDRIRLQDYELWTMKGTIVVWGAAPGFEKQGEATPQEKVNALLSFVKQRGPLDSQGIKILDVRSGKVVPGNAKLARENADFVKSTY